MKGTGSFILRLADSVFYQIAGGDEGSEDAVVRANGRVTFFIQEKLEDALGLRDVSPAHNFTLEPNEATELLQVDVSRVDPDEWRSVKQIGRQDQIFISCGQQSEQEKKLGKEILQLIAKKTEFDGYFAESQTSTEGVTSNIFNALYRAAGFIAIMHRRDILNQKNEYRGSVWIEQEIALAAFQAQTLNAAIPTKIYVQKGIKREGVRGYIIHKALEFEDDEEILKDLEAWLPNLSNQFSTSNQGSQRSTGTKAAISYPKIVDLIQNSHPKTDWRITRSQIRDVAVFKNDLNLRVEHAYEERSLHNKGFREAWANKFPDPNASSYYCEIYYGDSLLDRIVLVSVDVGRAQLPLPESAEDLTVTQLSYQIAAIFDGLETLTEYMNKAGFKLEAPK